MSRTSRRISRPLIGLLAVVIVLGAYFTFHKVKRARAQQPLQAAVPASATPAAASAKPSVAAAPQIAPTTRPAAAEVRQPDEPGALVTQTPTAPTGSAASEVTRDPQPAGDAADPPPPSNDLARVDLPSTAPSTDSIVTTAPQTQPAESAPNTEAPPSHALADAQQKMAAGDLLGARQVLNDALISGRLEQADVDSAKKQIDQISEAVVFSARKFPNDPWGGNYLVASGQRLATIAAHYGVSWEFLARVNGVSPRRLRSGQNIKIFKGPFHAIVYKSQFRMELYLGAPGGPGSMYVRSYAVGLGKDNSTPTGLWLCKAGDKIRNPRYYPPRGGDVIAPDDPKNPLGGYWIALEGLEGQALGKESYGIHGTIDPDSIGKMESMGCIRLKSDDIAWVFDMLVDGKSKVLVKD